MNQKVFLLVFFRYLVGIVIASLCWRCNEWVGLSMACTITDVLNNVKQISKIDSLHGHIANKGYKWLYLFIEIKVKVILVSYMTVFFYVFKLNLSHVFTTVQH